MRTPYDPSRSLAGPSPFDPGRRGVKALAVAAVVLVAAVAFFALRSRPSQESVPVVQTSASPSAIATELVVAVSGQVNRPGLVRLPVGARVADALQAAGGVLPGVDLSSLNLARKLTDGELIAVGVPGVSGVAGADPGAPPGRVNLNTATLAQLDTLPGVGPVLGQRIIDFRSKRGGFRSVNDLRQVEGVGEETFGRLKDLVVV